MDDNLRYRLRLIEHAAAKNGDHDAFETSQATIKYKERAIEILNSGNGRAL